jgi:hypothetical protein
LKGFPLSSPLTDGWYELLSAMQDVRSFAKEELADDESILLNKLIADVTGVVYR